MKARCSCDFEFFAEFTRSVCPKCGEPVEVIRAVVDFEDYRGILDEALVRVKRSIIVHGTWEFYSPESAFDAVAGEFGEYCTAFTDKNIHGPHGQIDELMDVIVTAAKGIRRLRCLQS